MTPEMQKKPRKRVRKEMLINAIPPEEVRIAILEDGVLEELYVERSTHESFVGNIYKGKIVNIEPSIQAAFVDFGVGRNGFLHVSDVDPQYYRHLTEGDGRRKDSLLDILDIPEISAEEEAALEASALADDDEEEEAPPAQVELIEDDSNEEVTPEGDEGRPPRERGYSRGRDFERGRDRSSRDRGGRRDRDDHGGRSHNRDRGERGGREGREGHGERGERDHGSRGRYGRDERRQEPAPVMGGTQTTPPVAAPTPPPPQSISEPTSSAFGFGILFEEPPQAIPLQEPAIAAEPTVEREETLAVTFTAPPPPPPAPIQDRVTTNESSFDLEDVSFRSSHEPPAIAMPAAERVAEGSREREVHATSFHPREENDASFAFNEDAPRAEQDIPNAPSGETREVEADLPTFDRGEEPESPLPTLEETQETEDEPITFDEDESGLEEVVAEPGHAYPPRREQRGRGRGDRSDRGGRGDRGDRGDRGRSRNGGGFGRGGPRRGGPREFGRDGPNAPPKPPIQEIFRRGQEVLVQVIKEGIGTKGPTLSTYISIPGRYLVVMPGLSRIGVSRKIGDDNQRRRLRNILSDLHPPRGLGFIIRTAGLDRTKKELQRDLAYLTRLWRVIAQRIKKGKGPAPIYQESDIITRTIRDIFTSEIEKIRVDEPTAFAHAKEFMNFVMPRYAERLMLEQGLEPIFHRFGIESELSTIQQKRVPLANGGSLIIEQAEALVAIDVNSGQFRQESDAEENAYQMNLAAAREVARQLRLRDLGGVIVIDFIDMRDERHRRDIENALRLAVSRDRARTKILRMSQFGIIQMTRQRIRPSLKRTSFDECPACRATGLVKTGETMSIEVMRLLQLAAWQPSVSRVRLRVAETVAQFLLNRKRREIAKLEDEGNIQVTILGVPHALPETLEIQCLDNSGGELRINQPAGKPARRNGR